MYEEIRHVAGMRFHYVAELEWSFIPGIAKIVRKYISLFQSETVRAYLLFQLTPEQIDDYHSLLVELYNHFRESDAYISPPETASPAHITVRYDNVLYKFKSKKYADSFMVWARSPRDASYLPLTMRKLSSWKHPAMKEILLRYLDPSWLTPYDVRLPEDSEKKYFPSLETIERELRFIAIKGLQYYPTPGVQENLRYYLNTPDKDIQSAIKRSLEKMNQNGK